MHEVRALLGPSSAPVPNPNGSWAILSFEIILHDVVDLTEPSQQRLIGTNSLELTGKWTGHTAPASTQTLGEALNAQPDLEGFLYPSSLVEGPCLAVFPDKLRPASSIRFHNEIISKDEYLR